MEKQITNSSQNFNTPFITDMRNLSENKKSKNKQKCKTSAK